MGTSTSYGGPPAEQVLLPSWALPASSDDATDPLPDVSDGDSPDSPEDVTGDVGPDGDSTIVSESSRVRPNTHWRTAKSNLTRFASGGGGSRAVRSAGRAYVRGRGGSGAATGSSTSGRSTAAGVGSFLSNLARRGMQAALESLGLTEYVGRSVQEVFAAIANVLAPDGARREETAARKAANEALYRVFQRCDFESTDISPLESMTHDDIAQAIRDTVSGYIYSRWLEELGKSIEKGSVSPDSAVRLERSIKSYVRESVKFETRDIDVLRIDWTASRGVSIIEGVFRDAYALLEVTR